MPEGKSATMAKFFIHVPATPFVEIDKLALPVGGSLFVKGAIGIGGRIFLAAGWPEFCCSNGICEGHILFCELENENLKMAVQICKQGTNTQMYERREIQAKDTGKKKSAEIITHDQNVRFGVKMVKTRLERGLSIPAEYGVHMPPIGREVIIRGPDGIQMPIKRRRARIYLSYGWRKLRNHYDLRFGDLVTFEIVAKFVWKMEICRAAKPVSSKKA